MGFIQFPVWRLFILTGQEVWWNSLEDVFSSFGAVVTVLSEAGIEKWLVLKDFQGKYLI